jgi:hypothetical protein
MFHAIEFIDDFLIDLEVPSTDRLERVLIRRNTRMQARIKPSVVETPEGPVEVADLILPDGTATRRVRFGCFRFAE